jgi:hypothetical protein
MAAGCTVTETGAGDGGSAARQGEKTAIPSKATTTGYPQETMTQSSNRKTLGYFTAG